MISYIWFLLTFKNTFVTSSNFVCRSYILYPFPCPIFILYVRKTGFPNIFIECCLQFSNKLIEGAFINAPSTKFSCNDQRISYYMESPSFSYLETLVFIFILSFCVFIKQLNYFCIFAYLAVPFAALMAVPSTGFS